jgi:hypothetical protein
MSIDSEHYEFNRKQYRILTFNFFTSNKKSEEEEADDASGGYCDIFERGIYLERLKRCGRECSVLRTSMQIYPGLPKRDNK